MVRLPVDSVGQLWKSASHQDLLDRAKASRTQMIVYYFGSGLHSPSELMPWIHSLHDWYIAGYPPCTCIDISVAEQLSLAYREATDFMETDPQDRILPYMTPLDYDRDAFRCVSLRASKSTNRALSTKQEHKTTKTVSRSQHPSIRMPTRPRTRSSTTAELVALSEIVIPSILVPRSKPSKQLKPSLMRHKAQELVGVGNTVHPSPQYHCKVESSINSSEVAIPTTTDNLQPRGAKRKQNDDEVIPAATEQNGSQPNSDVGEEKRVPVNSVAWAKALDGPWLPVFVCDPTILSPDVQNLGRINDRALQIAMAYPNYFSVLYYFGTGHFGILKSTGKSKEWRCPDHESFVSRQDLLSDEQRHSLANAVKYMFLASKFDIPYDSEDWHPEVYDADEEETKEVEIAECDIVATPKDSTKELNNSPSDSLEGQTTACDDTPEAPTRQTETTAQVPSTPAQSVSRPPNQQRSKIDLPPYLMIPLVSESTLTSNEYVVWAKRKNFPWWPGYVCNPLKLRGDLHYLAQTSVGYYEDQPRLTFVNRSSFEFSERLHATRHNNLKPWNGPDHESLVRGPPPVEATYSKRVREQFKIADFLEANVKDRLLPYTTPSDLDCVNLQPPEMKDVPMNCLVWALSIGYPWLPAFVHNPKTGGPMEHVSAGLLKRAKTEKGWLVYCFGLNCFRFHTVRGTIKLWKCPEYEIFMQGYGEASALELDAWETFITAIKEVKTFENSIAQNGDTAGIIPSFFHEVEHSNKMKDEVKEIDDSPMPTTETTSECGETTTSSGKTSLAEKLKCSDDFKYNPRQQQQLQEAAKNDAKRKGSFETTDRTMRTKLWMPSSIYSASESDA
ncbi:hypothetical protein Ae201684P_018974 [Aphanomyces euteiches]|nr:hypothetical protein Ae201684P_018974 [Aphanomyces euteiches]